ncbi:MAG: acylphosphatase [Parcubacteria group bacterium]
MNEIRSIVTGRVQMVMFRDFTRRQARSLGLMGTVKNLNDGTVEVVAQGGKEQLEVFIERLRKGSLFSRVDDVVVAWREPSVTLDGFHIIS